MNNKVKEFKEKNGLIEIVSFIDHCCDSVVHCASSANSLI